MASPLCVTVPLPFSLLKTLVCGFRACLGFPGGSDGKESACNARDLALIPGLGRSPEGGNGNPLQYSSLENPHGQRSLAGYSPWDDKDSDMPEQLSTQHNIYK